MCCIGRAKNGTPTSEHLSMRIPYPYDMYVSCWPDSISSCVLIFNLDMISLSGFTFPLLPLQLVKACPLLQVVSLLLADQTVPGNCVAHYDRKCSCPKGCRTPLAYPWTRRWSAVSYIHSAWSHGWLRCAVRSRN